MESISPFSLLALFIATVAVALLAFEAGLRFGQWRRQQADPEPALPARVLVASILGLLSFIMGFTFGLASSHFDSRNQSVFDEAIAIGTAYRRADLLPDPEREKMQELLRAYLDLRLAARWSSNGVERLAQVRLLQKQIWAEAVALGKKDAGQPAAPLVESLAEVINVHGERVLAGIRARIPLRVWMFLYLVTTLALGTAGYHSGIAGTRRRSYAALGYALVFSSVIVLIMAADVPGPEQVRMSHQVLRDLRARLTVP